MKKNQIALSSATVKKKSKVNGEKLAKCEILLFKIVDG